MAVFDEYVSIAIETLRVQKIDTAYLANHCQPVLEQAENEIACGFIFRSLKIIDNSQLEKIIDRNVSHLKEFIKYSKCEDG